MMQLPVPAPPLAAVETFVDPERFQGTAYKAGGWIELGRTSGCGRVSRDYYVRHNKPKRLFVRELCRNVRRGLQAEHLKPEWATVEQKVSPRCTHKAKEICRLVEQLKRVPYFRSRIQSYPVWSLLAIVALASDLLTSRKLAWRHFADFRGQDRRVHRPFEGRFLASAFRFR